LVTPKLCQCGELQFFERTWFERHPLRVAFDLLGTSIIVDRNDTRVKARIVEVEAYGGLEDAASHASMYRVGRETLMSGAGVLYMQFAYGLHTMTNIVCHAPGKLGAVLLRAAEDPVEGLELARERRAPRASSLLVGPACLSQGMGTLLSDTLVPLGPQSGIMIVPGEPVDEVRASPRIGITRAAEAQWRLFDGNSRFVSKHRRGDIVLERDLDTLIDQLPFE
jgi:DNA-3-methyladenine glycosylase